MLRYLTCPIATGTCCRLLVDKVARQAGPLASWLHALASPAPARICARIWSFLLGDGNRPLVAEVVQVDPIGLLGGHRRDRRDHANAEGDRPDRQRDVGR